MKLTLNIEIGERLERVLRRCFGPSEPSTFEIETTRRLKIIMSNQAEFDAQIQRANAALDDIALAVAAEAQQVADFIAAHPSVNTSALEGVVARLTSAKDSIGTVFEPPASEDNGGGTGDTGSSGTETGPGSTDQPSGGTDTSTGSGDEPAGGSTPTDEGNQ